MSESTPTLLQKLVAEFLGTFVLVFGVIGAALFAAGFKAGTGGLNVGFLGVALALGLSVMVSAYAFGPISGGHFNPAVTLGLVAAGRERASIIAPYLLAQVIGGIAASTTLLGIAGSTASFAGASTGYDTLSPSGFGVGPVFLVEVVTTAIFVLVILGVTGTRGAGNFAPIAIGLTLTTIALVAIPVSNGSFNPARSIATAIYGGPDALAQLWLSIVAPIVGAVIAALISRFVLEPATKK